MLRSVPRSVRVLVQLLLTAVVIGAALLYAPPIGAVSAKTLQHSLERETDGSIGHGRTCRRQRPGYWDCLVMAQGGSGGTTYRLHRDGRRCWDAVSIGIGSSPDLPVVVSGCTRLSDQVRLFGWS